MGLLRIIIALAIVLLCVDLTYTCVRSPPRGVRQSRRKRGDNGFKLIIGNSPSGYEPGKTYNLFLLGSRTHSKIQYFSHFLITAEASTGDRKVRSQVAGPKRVGRFQLFSDSLTRFNENCVNTVAEANDLPKTEVQVMWVAPESGSGCVSLSAMVLEDPRSWYADDGELTKVICEKQPDAEALAKECCACDEAKYSFVFEGIWSNETHPKDFPFAVWLTHFSDVIGASHDSNFSFWGENHISTDGFKFLAEFGSPSSLEQELRARGPRLRTLIKAAGLWYPHVNTNTSANFRVDRKHHKLSLASMFGPSPDWVVGVSGLDLCTEDCSWKESLDLDLYPWDAGTDSGVSYMSPNAETQPREKMYRITTLYPEDPRAPFYNPDSQDMVPLAKLYIRREKVIPRNCDEEFLQALQLDVSENTEDENVRPECSVTQFTEWSPCSVTCGKGIRMRTREYVQPVAAQAADCNRQLVSKEMCVAPVPECDGPPDDEDEGENLARSQALVTDDGEGAGVCKTSPWSDWSECSATCGIGITMRTRTFISHLGRKKCPHITIVEKQKCMQPDCTFTEEELPDPLCPVTGWSDWSPCTTTCGEGVSIRTRLPLVEPSMVEECKKRKDLFQQKKCTVREQCSITPQLAREICSMSPDVGPCRGDYNRYAFDIFSGTCTEFSYGGCKGNQNNFLTYDQCMTTCQPLINARSPQPNEDFRRPPAVASRSNGHTDPRLGGPLDCVMSDWSRWSPCSVSCGEGYSERRRYVVQHPSNGGVECPRKVVKRRKCVRTC